MSWSCSCTCPLCSCGFIAFIYILQIPIGCVPAAGLKRNLKLIRNKQASGTGSLTCVVQPRQTLISCRWWESWRLMTKETHWILAGLVLCMYFIAM